MALSPEDYNGVPDEGEALPVASDDDPPKPEGPTQADMVATSERTNVAHTGDVESLGGQAIGGALAL